MLFSDWLSESKFNSSVLFNENQWTLCYMTVVHIRKRSEEKKMALKPPNGSSKWSQAGSDDVFINAGEKDWWYLREPWQGLTPMAGFDKILWDSATGLSIVYHHLVRK